MSDHSSDHRDDDHDDLPHGADHDGQTMRVDAALVRELAKLVAEGDLGEIEVRDGDRRIRVSRYGAAPAPAPAPAPVHAAAPAAPAAAPSSAPATDAPAAAANPLEGAVPSPMVGTAYLAAEPGAAPFKSVGDKVSEGETVLIIEAMKVMNAIPAPRGGTLTAMLVDNGQPVEFDQPLFVIS